VLQLATWLGKRMDLHCTAVGKVLAAELCEERLDQLVRERPLVRHNDNTIASVKRFKQELERVRRQGFAVDDEEEEVGLRCVGVPVRNGSGNCRLAISVSGSTSHITAQNLPALVDELNKTAALISEVPVTWLQPPDGEPPAQL
jgi:DNA-binding IclR family transcriptional regulator